MLASYGKINGLVCDAQSCSSLEICNLKRRNIADLESTACPSELYGASVGDGTEADDHIRSVVHMTDSPTFKQVTIPRLAATRYEINRLNLPLSFLQRMMPVIEVATIPLLAGSNVREQGSEAARIWQDMLTTISQQDGCQDIYYGLEHENPNTAQLFIGKFEAT